MSYEDFTDQTHAKKLHLDDASRQESNQCCVTFFACLVVLACVNNIQIYRKYLCRPI